MMLCLCVLLRHLRCRLCHCCRLHRACGVAAGLQDVPQAPRRLRNCGFDASRTSIRCCGGNGGRGRCRHRHVAETGSVLAQPFQLALMLALLHIVVSPVAHSPSRMRSVNASLQLLRRPWGAMHGAGVQPVLTALRGLIGEVRLLLAVCRRWRSLLPANGCAWCGRRHCVAGALAPCGC